MAGTDSTGCSWYATQNSTTSTPVCPSPGASLCTLGANSSVRTTAAMNQEGVTTTGAPATRPTTQPRERRPDGTGGVRGCGSGDVTAPGYPCWAGRDPP